MSSIYKFKANSIKGEEIFLDTYKGKVLLIVNTASECGFTPQYTGLEELYQKYKEHLAVLGFPCNQFGGQESGTEESIEGSCLFNYNITFPMFSKVNVNGNDAHPLFSYLKSQKGSFLGKRIKWNFTKFLVDQSGKVVNRFAPTTTPKDIEKYILRLL